MPAVSEDLEQDAAPLLEERQADASQAWDRTGQLQRVRRRWISPATIALVCLLLGGALIACAWLSEGSKVVTDVRSLVSDAAAKSSYGQPRPSLKQIEKQMNETKGGQKKSRCVPISADEYKDDAINIILVPSGFDGDMHMFAEKAVWVFDVFSEYFPLDSTSIKALNVFYVTQEVANDQGKYCWYGCSGIDRLLCCETELFLDLASRACGQNIYKNVLVIHNANKYGGAGYMDLGLGTTSLHPSSPKIAAHETGHSLFNLADEYVYGWGNDVEANCDIAGCDKWSDLMGRNWDVGCFPGCQNGNFFAAQKASLMRDLSGTFGPANERVTCCKFLYAVEDIPRYCEKFDTDGLHIYQWCSDNIWSQKQPVWDGMTGDPWQHMVRRAEDPQGVEYVAVKRPVVWTLKKHSDETWTCEMKETAPRGLYRKADVEGGTELPGGGRKKVRTETLKVAVVSQAGHRRELEVDLNHGIEVPPALSDGLFVHHTVEMARSHVEIVLNHGDSCHPDVKKAGKKAQNASKEESTAGGAPRKPAAKKADRSEDEPAEVRKARGSKDLQREGKGSPKAVEEDEK